MKKFLTLFLVITMMFSCACTFAENQESTLPVCLQKSTTRYAESVSVAIEQSAFLPEEIDKDNIYIIEKKSTLVFDGGTDYNQYYVALPSLKTEDIRFASFHKGEYRAEGMNTLSWLNKVETHADTKIDAYITSNALENVIEAVSMIFSVSGRASINTYKVITETDTYYIPYYIDKVFNPANEESCSLELGKAYTEEDFAAITKAEAQSYLLYREAEKKAEEERLAAEAKAEAEKYRPVIALDENGDEVIKVNGTNLDDILRDLTDSIAQMGFASTVKMGRNHSDTEYTVTYRWQKGCNVNDVSRFAEGLFDELKTQIMSGKPALSERVSYCNFALKHDEGYQSIRHQVGISVWNDGVKITVNKDDAIEFKVRDSNAITAYINKYSNGDFDGFAYEKNDKNTPHIRGNIEGLTKTDIIEFDCTLPKNTDNTIAKEIGTSIHGTFERYRENKYRSTYILTLSGNLGTVSFCRQTQSSLSGEEEIFSNNIPVSFSNTLRYENGNIVEYTIGKESVSYDFKMVFKSNDISEVYFEDTKCQNLKYTQLTEDTKLSDTYVEKNKEVVLREAKECADTLYDLGLFKGTDKGYELEKSLTREESATILVRLLGKEENLRADHFNAVFVDVDKDRWSYAYIMYCYENNITKGTGKDTFSPNAQIDASQFITLLMRLLGYTEVNPDTALVKSVEYHLLPADKVEELTEKNVFTRNDMVQIVYNSLKTQMNDETVFAVYLLEEGILTEKELKQIK